MGGIVADNSVSRVVAMFSLMIVSRLVSIRVSCDMVLEGADTESRKRIPMILRLRLMIVMIRRVCVYIL